MSRSQACGRQFAPASALLNTPFDVAAYTVLVFWGSITSTSDPGCSNPGHNPELIAPGRRPSYRFTLDDLDELAGFVAAEANHAKVKKLEKELRRLYGRIAEVLESYTDEPGGSNGNV